MFSPPPNKKQKTFYEIETDNGVGTSEYLHILILKAKKGR